MNFWTWNAVKNGDQNSKLKIFLQTGKDPGRAARDGGEVRRRLAVRPYRLQVPHCPQYHHYLCSHCIVLSSSPVTGQHCSQCHHYLCPHYHWLIINDISSVWLSLEILMIFSFRDRMESSTSLVGQKCPVIFGNLEDIYQFHSQCLLPELERSIDLTFNSSSLSLWCSFNHVPSTWTRKVHRSYYIDSSSLSLWCSFNYYEGVERTQWTSRGLS